RAQLCAEVYSGTRSGAGTFAAASLPGRVEPHAGPPAGERRISALAAALPRYDGPSPSRLGPVPVGQPDLHSFPMEIWSKLMARHARRVRVKGLQYGDPMGLP